jgi:hypothetical protein
MEAEIKPAERGSRAGLNHSLCRGVAAKGHKVGIHFTSYSPQLGVLVLVGFMMP